MITEIEKKHLVKGVWRKITPKEGYVSKALRTFYKDLKDKKWSDPDFRKAKAIADRAVAILDDLKTEVELSKPKGKNFRKEGGGHKPQATEIRDALFNCFIDVLTADQ